MMGTAICEEKGSGVDKVIQAIELHQLPAPEFRAGFKRFSVVLLVPRSFEAMERNDRIRACYQHCCLRYVLHEKMTNQSLRERFKLPEARADTASQIISATLAAGLIRLDNASVGSRRYARYQPFWG